MQSTWENEIAELLTDILAVQDDLFLNLAKKRDLLKTADLSGLNALAQEEEQLVSRLQECIHRREQMLARTAEDGQKARSIRELAKKLPATSKGGISDRLDSVSSRARLLQHHSFTNWLVVQRTLIHLSQLIEIIATGGRLQPTYGDREYINANGALVDRAI
ncbi:MAG: flagellar export chaperone FlgN [Thermoguttaceae bacterium]